MAKKKKTTKAGKAGPLISPELAGLAHLFLTAFLFVSVFSFASDDPTFNQSINPWKVDNLAGSAGSYVAGALVEFFGAGAVLWPFLFLYLGLSRYVEKIRMNRVQWLGFWGTFLCLILWLQHPWFSPTPEKVYDLSGGGIIGRFLNGLAQPYLHSVGTFLAWLFLTMVFLHLFLGISWFAVLKRIRSMLYDIWCKYSERRKRKAKAKPASKKVKKDKEDKVEPVVLDEDFIITPIDEQPAKLDKPATKPRKPKKGDPVLPELDLLAEPPENRDTTSPKELEILAQRLTECLADFNIQGEIQQVMPGPVVTMFEFKPAPGVKISRIAALSDDIALALKAMAVRIVAPIPGKDSVGVEIPNQKRQTVFLREIFESDSFVSSDSAMTLALGKDIQGRPKVADLASMPHLLVAGATGAGKSVCLNALLLSFLYKCGPDELKLLLVDPKRIELAVYAKLPHLVHPVVTDMSLAKSALEWAVYEMDRRYECMARLGVRNIASYNKKLESMKDEMPEDLQDLEPIPYLVVVIDELADLMLTAAKEAEMLIVRLAQLARAAGIHMILATQRPSVDVVTGLIKANFPTRISFQVSSRHDSRTILDTVGAERLLGRGDMLYKPSGAQLIRLHGALVNDREIVDVVNFWNKHHGQDFELDFVDWKGSCGVEENAGGGPGDGISDDPMYNDAVEFVMSQGKASISLIQRQFRIGFNRAARVIEQMEQDGILGPQEGSKPRKVLGSK